MKDKLSILALEPFYSGSHKACIDSWISRSVHDFTLLQLPGEFWRWRSRHSSWTFARMAADLVAKGKRWDVVFCTELLNLAEFKGLASEVVRRLPAVVYFHENQLVYPIHEPGRRDQSRIIANFSSSLAATEVWFNSGHNRDTFLGGLPDFFSRMPDQQPLSLIGEIRNRSRIVHLGVEAQELFPSKPCPDRIKPLHLLWAARWENDKNPQHFFEAVTRLHKASIPFRLSVIGECPNRKLKPLFNGVRQQLAEHIENWGYMKSRENYLRVLADADVIVSTSNHEFFGISILEAVVSGAFPVLPDRLAYPEVFTGPDEEMVKDFFFDGTVDGLSARLMELARQHDKGEDLWSGLSVGPEYYREKYDWNMRAKEFDLLVKQVYVNGCVSE